MVSVKDERPPRHHIRSAMEAWHRCHATVERGGSMGLLSGIGFTLNCAADSRHGQRKTATSFSPANFCRADLLRSQGGTSCRLQATDQRFATLSRRRLGGGGWTTPGYDPGQSARNRQRQANSGGNGQCAPPRSTAAWLRRSHRASGEVSRRCRDNSQPGQVLPG